MENIWNVITATSAIVGVAVAAWAVIAGFRAIDLKREDDRRAGRLNRINLQLSELYGKLAFLDKAGSRNWNAFVFQYSNDNKELGREFMRFFPYMAHDTEPITLFNPPPPDAEQLKAYRDRLRMLFMVTNESMLDVISSNAGLAVGGEMPSVFVIFAEHVASLRLLIVKLKEEEELTLLGSIKSNFLDNWKEYTDAMAPHPAGMGHYITASFEVLKEEQERLLSTHETPLTEKELAYEIDKRKRKVEIFWYDKEYQARKRVHQHYPYQPPAPLA